MLPLFGAPSRDVLRNGSPMDPMSQNDTDDEPSGLPERLRTVTPASKMRRNVEMDTIGWMIFAGLLVVALPLLPILVVVWLLMKVFGRAADQAAE